MVSINEFSFVILIVLILYNLSLRCDYTALSIYFVYYCSELDGHRPELTI